MKLYSSILKEEGMRLIVIGMMITMAYSFKYWTNFRKMLTGPKFFSQISQTFSPTPAQKEYLCIAKELSNSSHPEFYSLVQDFLIQRPNTELLSITDSRLLPSNSDKEPKLFWYFAHSPTNLILDGYQLERPFLGKQPYSIQETILKWNSLLDERKTILQKGCKFSSREPYRSELDLLLSLLQRISYVVKSYQEKSCSESQSWGLGSFQQQEKVDNSPVTTADYAIQAILVAKIHQYYPNDLFIAEETAASLLQANETFIEDILQFIEVCLNEKWTKQQLLQIYQINEKQQYQHWKENAQLNENPPRVWIIDPVDGTKGFLQGKHFAIAVSMVDSKSLKPLLSLIACPTLQSLPSLSQKDPLSSLQIPKPLRILDSDLSARSNDVALKSFFPKFPDLQMGNIFFTFKNEGVVYSRTLSMPLGSAYSITADDNLNDEGNKNRPDLFVTVPFEAKHHDHKLCDRLFHSLEEKLNQKIHLLPMHGQGKYCIVVAGVANAYIKISTIDDYTEKLYDHIAGQHLLTELDGETTNLYGESLNYNFSTGKVDNTRSGQKKNGIIATKKLKFDLNEVL